MTEYLMNGTRRIASWQVQGLVSRETVVAVICRLRKESREWQTLQAWVDRTFGVPRKFGRAKIGARHTYTTFRVRGDCPTAYVRVPVPWAQIGVQVDAHFGPDRISLTPASHRPGS